MEVAGNRERADRFREVLDDQSAFRAWYEGALPRVYGYVLDAAGGARSVAEEITQEAFVEAVRARAKFDGRADPVTWVCAIARHKVADHYRRLQREERRRLRLLSERQGEETDASERRRSEDRDAVLRALAELPPMQRAALILRYLDDLPVGEVARLLGKSEGAVGSLLTRGKQSSGDVWMG